MRSVAPLLALLLVLPLVGAQPTHIEDGRYWGIAEPLSVDRWEDWHEEPPTCTAAQARFMVTLRVVRSHADDVLTLAVGESDGLQLSAPATVHFPATLVYPSSDGCPDFTVTGTRVTLGASYVVSVVEISW